MCALQPSPPPPLPLPHQGVRFGNPAARAAIPRILQLLSFDNEPSGVVGATLDRLAPELPLWV